MFVVTNLDGNYVHLSDWDVFKPALFGALVCNYFFTCLATHMQVMDLRLLHTKHYMDPDPHIANLTLTIGVGEFWIELKHP